MVRIDLKVWVSKNHKTAWGSPTQRGQYQYPREVEAATSDILRGAVRGAVGGGCQPPDLTGWIHQSEISETASAVRRI